MILQTNIDAVTGLDDLDQNPFGAAHFALPRPVNGATKVCLATHTHTQATRHLRTLTPLTHPNHQQLRMRRLPPVGSEARKVQRAASGYRAACDTPGPRATSRPCTPQCCIHQLCNHYWHWRWRWCARAGGGAESDATLQCQQLRQPAVCSPSWQRHRHSQLLQPQQHSPPPPPQL